MSCPQVLGNRLQGHQASQPRPSTIRLPWPRKARVPSCKHMSQEAARTWSSSHSPHPGTPLQPGMCLSVKKCQMMSGAQPGKWVGEIVVAAAEVVKLVEVRMEVSLEAKREVRG